MSEEVSSQSKTLSANLVNNKYLLLVGGLSATAVAALSYVLYVRFFKGKRSNSMNSSSESEDDTALLRQMSHQQNNNKGASTSSLQNKGTKQNQNPQLKNGRIQTNNGKRDRVNNQIKGSSGHKSSRVGTIDQNDSLEKLQHLSTKKAIYFDSNDEMFWEEELPNHGAQSEDDLNSSRLSQSRKNKASKHAKMYTKVFLRATEEEKKRLREYLNKMKKRNIQRFLQDVNEKKGTFINQKKKMFKEDLRMMSGPKINAAVEQESQGSRTTSTNSEEPPQSQAHGPSGIQNQISLMQQEQFMQQHQKQMARYMNTRGNNKLKKNGVLELSPNDFSSKDRYRWFDFLQMYTNNFIQDEEFCAQDNQQVSYRQRLQMEKYYTQANANQQNAGKKRSASMD